MIQQSPRNFSDFVVSELAYSHLFPYSSQKQRFQNRAIAALPLITIRAHSDGKKDVWTHAKGTLDKLGDTFALGSFGVGTRGKALKIYGCKTRREGATKITEELPDPG
jgi:hypothetical protein